MNSNRVEMRVQGGTYSTVAWLRQEGFVLFSSLENAGLRVVLLTHCNPAIKTKLC